VEVISFAGDGLAPDLIPSEELADCAGTALEADGGRILSYGTGAGYTPLRELLGEQLGVHPQRVLLTNGWLQGFALIVEGRVSAQKVVVDYPTYDRALRLLYSSAAELVFLDLHEEGPTLDLLKDTLRSIPAPALALTTPTFHNPTGLSLSLEERNRLGTMLLQRGTLILEDDSYGLLRYEGEPLPTMFELSERTIAYSTSFSHTIAPGLRVGVFVLPDELAAELAAKANSTYITPVLLGQATVFEFLQRGSFEPNLERLTSELGKRRDAMLAALEQHFAGSSWSRPEGGIFVLLRLPPGTNAKQVIERAEGVTADAGADLSALPNAIRLNFAGVALEEIEPGIERLAAAFELAPGP